MILGRVIWRKLSGSKGRLSIIFYKRRMMKDGHFSFQTQSPKLKSNSLQEEKLFVFFAIFHHFFNILFFSWLLFRADQIFQVHDMTINFFFSFFHFFHNFSTPGNDTCHRWSSKLKHLFSVWGLFWKVGLLVQGYLYHFCPKKGLWFKSVIEKWVILVNMPQGINQGDFRISRF